MIVQCPECETGYNLSPDKVPAKGSKIRCSKCQHIFRVRISAAGQPEIFYKNQKINPNATMIGAPMVGGSISTSTPKAKADPKGFTSFDARGGTVPRMRQTLSNDQSPPPKVKALSTRKPILTPPAFNLGMLNESTPPPPPPPLSKAIQIAKPQRKLTPAPSQEINLFGDESGFDADNKNALDDPFSGAFDDETGDDFFSSTVGPKDDFFSSSPSEEIEVAKKGIRDELERWEEEEPALEKPDDFFNRGGSVRHYDELQPNQDTKKNLKKIVPDLGIIEAKKTDSRKEKVKEKKSTSSFQENEEKLELAFERPPAKKRSRPQASTADPKKSRSSRPKKKSERKNSKHVSPKTEGPAKKENQLKKASPPIAPHKVGGNTLRRIGDTLFIALIIGIAFVGVIAYQAGGFFDFTNPLHMLEVAFDGKTYQPSPALRTLLQNKNENSKSASENK